MKDARMSKSCGNCDYYDPLKGEPSAGYCCFADRESLPYWMENYRTHINRLGHDVVASDGEDCAAHKPSN